MGVSALGIVTRGLIDDDSVPEPSGPTLTSVVGGDEQVVVTLVPSATVYYVTYILYRIWAPFQENVWTSTTYTGTAGTSDTKTITGLDNYKFYEFIIYDESRYGTRSAPSASKIAFTTDNSSDHQDRLIVVRDRVESAISEFSQVKIRPQQEASGELPVPYCIVLDGGYPNTVGNASFLEHTVLVVVVWKANWSVDQEEIVVNENDVTSLAKLSDKVKALFSPHSPSGKTPYYYASAQSIGSPQYMTINDVYLYGQVVTIKCSCVEA